jgi:CRISPR-associated protein Cas1
MLNYAYGVLESQVRMQVVAAGLDPTIGILHGNARGQHGLVYDLIASLPIRARCLRICGDGSA